MTLRRTLISISSVAVLVASLGACSKDKNDDAALASPASPIVTATQTASPTPAPSVTSTGKIGAVSMTDLKVYAKDIDAALTGTFTNNNDEADELIGVRSPAAPSIRISGTGDDSSTTIPLPKGQSYTVSLKGITIDFFGLEDQLPIGTPIQVTFTFKNAGDITETVPVELYKG